MNGKRTTKAAAVATILAIAAAGCSGSSDSSSDKTANAKLVNTMPAGKKAVDSINWALYRSVGSLDPVVAFDYPENTVLATLCEPLLKQSPDGSIGPGLATLEEPDATTMTFTLKNGVTFWDGKPVTPEDVIFSLKRAANPESGSYYAEVFQNVADIKASGHNAVTITLKKHDEWLKGELASLAGIVLQKDFTEKQGAAYGTIEGGTMCSGSYKLASWTSSDLTVTRNDTYWDSAVKPKTKDIHFKAVADTNTLTAGLLSGEIDGGYASGPIPGLNKLDSSPKVNVIQGPAQQTDALVVSNAEGPLGDVKVRQALSAALDRAGLVKAVYGGAAEIPRWISNPGTFGYGKSTFDAAYAKAPEMKQDLKKAKSLIKGVDVSKTITIATTPSNPGFAAAASAYQSAGTELGLKVKIKALSAQNYISLFTDPKAREGVDGFLTVNYGDWADPAAFLRTIALPTGSQNYSAFEDAQLTSLMEQASEATDEDERAKIMVQASERAAELLPWIPNVQPTNVLVLSSKLTGAVSSFSYMFAPWANDLGGK